MSLNVCAHCTTKFSIGALHCPQCGNADFYEEGSMPKISRHGGATYPIGVVPADSEPDPPTSATPSAVELVLPGVEVAEYVEPEGADDAPDGPYAGMLRPDLQAACAARGLPTSGNKPELIARLVAADEAALSALPDEAESELGTVPVDPA